MQNRAPRRGRGAEVGKCSVGAELSITSRRHSQQEVWSGRVEIYPPDEIRLVTESYGVPAIFAVVRDNGQPVDIGCFASTSPEIAYTVRGASCLIGWAAYDHALITGERLRLHETLGDWVAAGGSGAVALDWFVAQGLFCQLKGITCGSSDHALEVSNRLEWCGVPVPRLHIARAST